MISIKKGNDKLVMTLNFGRSYSKDFITNATVFVEEGLFKTENGMSSCAVNMWLD